MGRPVNSKSFGAPTVGDTSPSLVFSSCWLPTEQAAAPNCYIIKQTGTSSYLAMNPATSNTGVVKLVQTITLAGQAIIPVAPSGAGVGAVVTAIMAVTAGTFTAAGTGYAVNDTLTLVGGTGTAAIFTVSSVTSGAITGLTLTSTGAYSVLPASGALSTTTNHAGTGATITIGSFHIASFHIVNGGEDYTSATLVVSGGGAGTLSVTAGAVTAAVVTTAGTFTSVPTCTVNSPVALQTAAKITSVLVHTFEGNDYSWRADATLPDSTYAALPLFV